MGQISHGYWGSYHQRNLIYKATGVGEVEDLLRTVIIKYITMPHVISCFAYK
jgi:hypothetical protein